MPLPATIEATVTSKGQVTLPKELRQSLGIQTGSKVRFTVVDRAATIEPVLMTLEESWAKADAGPRTPFMSFAEMNAAKVRRKS